MIIKTIRLLYQLLLIFTIVYLSVWHPELTSLIMVLCTWYLASVIRESREDGKTE